MILIIASANGNTAHFLQGRYAFDKANKGEIEHRLKSVLLHAQRTLIEQFREFVQREHGDLMQSLAPISFQVVENDGFLFWLASVLFGSRIGDQFRENVAHIKDETLSDELDALLTAALELSRNVTVNKPNVVFARS